MGDSPYAVPSFFDGVPVEHMVAYDKARSDARRIAAKAKVKRSGLHSRKTDY